MTLFVKSSKIKQKLYEKNLKKRTKQTKEEYKHSKALAEATSKKFCYSKLPPNYS